MNWLIFALLISLGGGYGAVPPPAPDSKAYISASLGRSFIRSDGFEGTKKSTALITSVGLREPFGIKSTRVEFDMPLYALSNIDSFKKYSESRKDADNYSSKTFEGLFIFGLFLNGYYEFPLSETVRPYIGAGVGALAAESYITEKEAYGYYAGSSHTTGSSGNGTNHYSYKFAPQYIAGIEFKLPDSPRGYSMSLGAEYRYVAADFGFTNVSIHALLLKMIMKI